MHQVDAFQFLQKHGSALWSYRAQRNPPVDFVHAVATSACDAPHYHAVVEASMFRDNESGPWVALQIAILDISSHDDDTKAATPPFMPDRSQQDIAKWEIRGESSVQWLFEEISQISNL